jgi:hypothetical protein
MRICIANVHFIIHLLNSLLEIRAQRSFSTVPQSYIKSEEGLLSSSRVAHAELAEYLKICRI